MHFLCADVGTSRMKIALTDTTGHVHDMVSQNLQVLKKEEGFCEMDMNEVWDIFTSLCLKIKERNVFLWNRISGIGVTGQGDGLWAIDQNGDPIRYAILWNDTRTKHMIRTELDHFCTERSVNIPFSGSFHMLLMWLKEKENENYKRISFVFHCKDWINFRLTGTPSCDYSDASLAGFDLFDKEYCGDIFDEMALPGTENRLPQTYPSGAIVGSVSEFASASTGLTSGLPVIAGAIDVCSVAHGVGVRQPGETCVIIGTTLCTEVVVSKDQVDFERGMVACHTKEDLYLSVMPTLSGTTSLDWAKSILYSDKSYKDMERELFHIPVGSNGVFYHPYLYGERAPFRNPFARGGFYGLSAVHSRKEMMRAVFEGLALSLYDCLKTLPESGDILTVCGGGSASDLLCQIIADCTGRTVVRSPHAEAGIKGVSDILKATIEGFDEEYNRKAHNALFQPDTEMFPQYESLYHTFHELTHSMEGFWSERRCF